MTNLAFDVFARDRGASRTFLGIGNAGETAGRRLAKVGAGIKYATLGLAGGLSAAAVAGFKLASSAAEDEVSAKKMALQFRNSADATRGQIGATEDWITAQGKAVGIADAELRPALGRMVAATHDVRKAREQVSLAENVAVGRGKSLATVTEALAKAQLGSLTGLAKLGVQTKDAEGKTRSLKDITADLARTYEGQAAKAAGTAQGQFGRLKLMLSETGEAIGYKLLPMGVDLASWLLDDGIPAVSGFVDELRGGTEEAVKTGLRIGRDLLPHVKELGAELLDLAGGVVDVVGPLAEDLLPTVLDLADASADLARWIDDLPGPIKTIAVEAAIAAVVLPRMTAAVTAGRQQMVTAAASARVYAIEIRNAETRSAALSTGLGKMSGAAKTAAGIGGAAALSQSFGETNYMLQYLERTAGGAAVGLSVGGPLGAAIGGLAGAGWSLYDSFQATDGQIEESKKTVLDYADAVDKATGKLNANVRATIVLGLQQDELIAPARMLGLTTRDLVDATLGNAGAVERVSAAWKGQGSILTGLQGHKISEWVREQGIELNNTRREARDAASGYTSMRKALEGLPRDVKIQLKNVDYKPSLEEWRKLNREVDLTPRQREIVIKAIGYDPAITGARKVNRELDKVGKQKPNLAPWANDLVGALTGVQQVARMGAHGIGDAMKQGVLEGFDGTASSLSEAASYAVHQAISAGRAAGEINSPSRKMRREVGQELTKGGALGIRDNAHLMARAGADSVKLVIKTIDGHHDRLSKSGAGMLSAMVHGIRSGKPALKDALDDVMSYLSNAKGRTQSRRDERSGFVGGFQGFTSSVFGGDYGDVTTVKSSKTDPITGEVTESESQRPLTVADILARQQSEEAKAASLRDDIAKLSKKGPLRLSDELLEELAAQGAAGIDQIHLLATQGDAKSIKALNQSQSNTAADLKKSGGAVAGALGYDDRIAKAQANEDLAERIAKHLRNIMREDGDEGVIHIHLEGQTLVESIKKHKRKAGGGKLGID